MKYRKLPVVIDAIQFKIIKEIPCKFGTHKETNSMEIAQFIGNALHGGGSGDNQYILIQTLEGEMRANLGDYIIKGVSGEFYPCKPDIFEKTYEAAETPCEVCDPAENPICTQECQEVCPHCPTKA